MTKRELMRLPLDIEFQFTDGNWEYSMKKILTDNSGVMYSWKCNSYRNESFCMFENIYNDHDEEFLHKKLDICISVGGFSAHSEVSYFQLSQLTLINENSLKKYLANH